MVQYKLYYFNLRGRAELARLVFAAAGQEYEDVRIKKEDWPNYKPNAPFGQGPYLEVHDGSNVFKMAQSISIARFLAKRFNLAGVNDLEEATINMYADQLTDFVNEISKVFYEQDATKKAELTAKLEAEIVPKHMKFLEDKLNQTKTGYFVGNSLTWIDLYLIAVLEWLNEKRQSLFDHFPTIKKHDETVRGLPNVAKWLATRPVTEM